MSYNIDELRQYYLANRSYAEDLATKTLEYYFGEEPPIFPINVFEMLRNLGVFYEFRKLDNLEGAYSPDTEDYSAAVLINFKRPFTRQRFTAAHELCHHIKDFNRQIVCPLSKKNHVEKYADRFASELIMPLMKFKEEADKLVDESGKVDPSEAYYLCHFFGASFQAVIWKLYNNGYLSFQPDELFFKGAKPKKVLDQFGNKHFLEHIVNGYSYLPQESTSPLWHRFKNELVYNDSRLEGLEIIQEDTAEILTDLRLYGQKSKYYRAVQDKEICEVIGHSYIYNYVIETDERPDRYQLCHLCRLLYYLSPYSEQVSKFRESNNFITGAKISTVDYTQIETELFWVDKQIDQLISDSPDLDISEFLLEAVKVHHKITQIHPFNDGNGRTSRALLNWLLKIKRLPPVYVPYKQKSEYIECLESADNGKFECIHEFFLFRLLDSFIQLNDELSLTYDVDLILES